jgi:hypothetical protein
MDTSLRGWFVLAETWLVSRSADRIPPETNKLNIFILTILIYFNAFAHKKKLILSSK